MPTRARAILAAGVLSVALALLPSGTSFRAAAAQTQPAAKRLAKTRPATQPKGKTRKTAATKPPSLDQCRALYMKGDYAGASKGYRKLISDKSVRVAASVGLAEALAMRGDYEEGLDALKSLADAGKADANWHVAMADLLATIGKYKLAATHARRAHKLRPDMARAILIRGMLAETLGRKKHAVAVYKSMSQVTDGEAYLKDARALVALGQIQDRYAVLTGQKASLQADNIYNNYLRRAYMEVDDKYWPAYVAAGTFALSKHRVKTAAHEFGLAAKINKRIPAVHVGLGIVQLSKWRFEKCMRSADAALKINPRYPDAFVLKAFCYMKWRKFDKVKPLLDKVLAINPNHIEALSLMAAVHVRTFKPKQAEPFIARVREIDPNNAELHSTIGQWLASGRQFERAEKHYLRAIELAPEQAGPVADLGELYMQTGQETKALEVLEKAHEIDDFRADILNYIKLLRDMEKFRVKETEHFIIKLDPTRDAVLLDQVAEYMESIYEDICKDYAYYPTVKTIIEIFPMQKQFSVRLTGRGRIRTVGACTGRVIMLAAPDRDKRTPLGTHNWAVVLRHEFTHTITLTGTRNRIPHWFTEACAVWQQPDKRSYANVRVLADATARKRLFHMKDLDWGFIRPKRRGDRALAYAQSEWISEFIITTRGYETIPKMLKGFRDGMSQADVFEKIVGAPEGEFDKKFRAWAVGQVEKWGFPTSPPPNLAKAAKEAKAKPKDAAAQVRLAVAQYSRGKTRQARATAKKALNLDPGNVKALEVLAQCLAAGKNYDEAIAAAGRLSLADKTSAVAPRVLARCYLAKKGGRNYAKAIGALELLKQRRPLEEYSYRELANLYTTLGMSEKALPNLIHLHRHTMMTPKYARKVAEIYRALGKDELAMKFYREVLYINPYDPSVYDAVAGMHRKARRYDRAIEAIRKLTLLQPAAAASWNKLAVIKYRAWNAASHKSKDLLFEARDAAQKALAIEPNGQAASILERIEDALKQ